MENLTENDWFLFAEFCGAYYVRSQGCWVHKNSNQFDKNNYIQTNEVFEEWMQLRVVLRENLSQYL